MKRLEEKSVWASSGECGKPESGPTACDVEDTTIPPKRPEPVVYNSLAEMYGAFIETFVSKSPILAACGCVVHCYEHHFVHVVKLNAGFDQEPRRLFFPDEKPLILASVDEFGPYVHDGVRARNFASALLCLTDPDYVVRSAMLGTADRAFIKEFDANADTAYTVVLVGIDGGTKQLYTGFPVRRRKIRKFMDGEILYRKTARPPL